MSSCPVRANSTHALQALALFNSEFAAGQASAFAERPDHQTVLRRQLVYVAVSRASRAVSLLAENDDGSLRQREEARRRLAETERRDAGD